MIHAVASHHPICGVERAGNSIVDRNKAIVSIFLGDSPNPKIDLFENQVLLSIFPFHRVFWVEISKSGIL